MNSASLRLFISLFYLLLVFGCNRSDDSVNTPSGNDVSDNQDGNGDRNGQNTDGNGNSGNQIGQDQVNDTLNDAEGFNIDTFKKSFEQLFVPFERYAWDFTHEIEDSTLLKTYQNNVLFGEVGNRVFTITHHLNDSGQIVSSSRVDSLRVTDEVSFTYRYDSTGLISQLTKIVDNKVVDVVNVSYNESGAVMKKSHKAKGNREAFDESFEYDKIGNLIRFTDGSNKWEYSYDGAAVREVKTIDSDNRLTRTLLTYDNQERLSKKIMVFSDGNEILTEVDYSPEEYVLLASAEGLLQSKHIYSNKSWFASSTHWEYNYDQNKNYLYSFVKEESVEGNTTKKSYYEGSLSSPELVGYTVIDDRDQQN